MHDLIPFGALNRDPLLHDQERSVTIGLPHRQLFTIGIASEAALHSSDRPTNNGETFHGRRPSHHGVISVQS
jgi:hypothetical protein